MNYNLELEQDEEEIILSEDELINKFINTNNNIIMRLCNDIKIYNYFLDRMYYTELMSFIIDKHTTVRNAIKLTKFNLKFMKIYKNEILSSLYILNNGLANIFYELQITEYEWLEFCYKNTSYISNII